MIYRRGWVPILHRHQLEKILKDEGFKNHEEITNFLCGSRLEDERHHFAYQVVDNTKWVGQREAKFWQRLNRLWLVPLCVITIPFQWLFRGRVGFESTSKIGALFQRITGLD
ncbi:hypothetical protein RPW61_22695 [Citrobacter freundii]|uniref:hypothetical protein n=1 Tax=Citrobacter freundii TaxID=546 RepID=UPI0028E17CE0|nr:hypothetical protein [Citrobacter freundii]MDT9381200.1 hypothetical protein [Citrobacter freundii]